MAKITDYASLITAVHDWSARSDISTTLIEQFIGLAEAKASESLRVPAMEVAKEVSSVNGNLKIPSDYLQLRAITSPDGDSSRQLRYVSMDNFMLLNHPSDQESLAFTRQGPYWYLASNPGDGTNYTCFYYAGIDALDSLNPVNWLLQMAPQLYLYGALWFLFEYTFDEPRSKFWAARFDTELQTIQAIADAAEHRGSILAVSPIN